MGQDYYCEEFSNICGESMCEIDLKYVKKIRQFFEDNSYTFTNPVEVTNNSTCSPGRIRDPFLIRQTCQATSFPNMKIENHFVDPEETIRTGSSPYGPFSTYGYASQGNIIS